MKSRTCWVMAFCFFAVCVAIVLVLTQHRYHADRQRLIVWQHLAPPAASAWSVAQWKRALRNSRLSMPTIQERGKQLILRWTSVEAGEVLSQVSFWLVRSSWHMEHLQVSNHAKSQFIEVQLRL